MSRFPRPSHTRWLLLLIALAFPIPSHAAATPYPVHQPWAQCLDTEARRIGLNPILLHAIVHAESREQPYAFGWTDHRGARQSWTAPTHADAARFLHRLLQTQRNFDAGLAQINVQNIPRLTKQLGIHPHQILDPCTNLTLSAMILKEAVNTHGYTWRAIAAYNGSLDYIPLVWTNLCRVHRYADCPPSGVVTARPHPPAPSDPLRLTRTPLIAFTTEDADSSAVDAPQHLPHVESGTPLDKTRIAVSGQPFITDLKGLPSLLVKSIVPFSLCILMIVVVSLGIRISLWAMRGVRSSYRLFTGLHIPPREPSSPHPPARTSPTHLHLRSPRS